MSNIKRILNPIIDIDKLGNSIINIKGFLNDYYLYKKLGGSISLHNLFPILDEKTNTTGIDKHYFYQDLWAFKKIVISKTNTHIDVGSNHKLISFLTTICKVEFVDIRPLDIEIENFKNKRGSILELPYETSSVNSLSCLHVAEHIGLGRYGDPIDPEGTKKACKELERVLAIKGSLYFGLPIGKPIVCFNAHRIHNSSQILEYFNKLKLISFSAVDDNGEFHENVEVNLFDNSKYACGMFHFMKL